ncbi:hypothetical protein IDG67_14200, partial [Staphylococcus sp. EG-SA-19]|nr:hypothetical protein [Staphylococcus sp. EG-SA-19]
QILVAIVLQLSEYQYLLVECVHSHNLDIDSVASLGNHNSDILLGTQMIAKGLDYPNITLVGVLNADTMLNLPDFRASERT